MEISLEDFNALSAERSCRDVKIAQLEMTLETERAEHQHETEEQAQIINALQNENIRLKNQLDMMQDDFENLRFENHWMKQYILISVDRVRYFFSHIRNIEILSAIKSFVLQVLPENTPDEAIAFVTKTMELPMQEDAKIIKVEGNYNDFHDNGNVNVK